MYIIINATMNSSKILKHNYVKIPNSIKFTVAKTSKILNPYNQFIDIDG